MSWSFVADGTSEFKGEDQRLLDAVKATKRPVLLVLNKADQMRDKRQLLPILEAWSKRHEFASIIPLSALRADGLDRLMQELGRLLPEGEALFPDDQLTDRSLRYLAAECIREQVFVSTNKEVPYSTAVTIESFEDPLEGRSDVPGPNEKPTTVRIAATIHVERDSQRAIVIGKGGQMLKTIGTAARGAIETLVGQKVFLELFVRVEPDWSQNPRAMKKLGYE